MDSIKDDSSPSVPTSAKGPASASDIVLSNGIVIKTPTSLASRKRRRKGLSMKELTDDTGKFEKGGEEIINYDAGFAPMSMAHYTWGIANAAPIQAVERKRAHGRFRKLRKGAFSKNSNMAKLFMPGGESLFQDELDVPQPVLPNGPDRSILLRFPLEIRREIYGYLLIHEEGILVQSNWCNVTTPPKGDHNILRVCKQIALESACFLYERNVFRSLIGNASLNLLPTPTSIIREAVETLTISPKFLPFFRNVVVDFRTTNFSKSHHVEATGSIVKLIESGAVLDSLTFVISPRTSQSGTFDPSTMTWQNKTTRFANFFSAKSKLMQAMARLPCKTMNVILNLPKNRTVDPPKSVRVLITIDVRYLALNQVTDGWLAKDYVAKRSRKRNAVGVKMKLKDLERTIEEMVEDYEKAVAQGKGRLLRCEEEVSDGMLLVRNG